MKNIDLLISCLAREIKNKDVVFLGVVSPIPLLAIGLAKYTHAPDLIFINSLGAVDPEIKFSVSSETVNLSETNKRIKLHEIYDIAQKGMLDITFFSGAQVDSSGNINLSVIGDYKEPKVRLPGGAGSPVLIRLAKKSIILCKDHDKRKLSDKLFFTTSSGNPDKKRFGRSEKIITGKCIFELGENGAVLESIHQGESIEDIQKNTGFEFKIPKKIKYTEKITEKEKLILDKIDPDQERYSL
ncbi:CoA-transferase [Candidatus Woesearchaeota archaeon]|nr:CoA-transferase [Candidatus Woesearchaeota archaeon]